MRNIHWSYSILSNIETHHMFWNIWKDKTEGFTRQSIRRSPSTKVVEANNFDILKAYTWIQVVCGT